jgi:hypothetical protein
MSQGNLPEKPGFSDAIAHLLAQESASYNDISTAKSRAWSQLVARTALLAPLTLGGTQQASSPGADTEGDALRPATSSRTGASRPGTPSSVPVAPAAVSAKVATLMLAGGVALGAAGYHATLVAFAPGHAQAPVATALVTRSMQNADSSAASERLVEVPSSIAPIASSVDVASLPLVAPFAGKASASSIPVSAAAASATSATDATNAAGAPPVPSPQASRETLVRERELVDTMRSGLARGRPADALEAGAEHARTFARGALAEEREVLAITALMQLGRVSEARARATRFRREHPQSFLQPPKVPEGP